MMEQVALVPPLPPKTRRAAPPEAHATVLTSNSASAAQVFSAYSFPEVHSSLSQITTTTTGAVKIRINPDSDVTSAGEPPQCASTLCKVTPCIRINVNHQEDMLQRSTMAESFMKSTQDPYFFYSSFPSGIVMSSGQVSPSDTLDSGTCSDLDSTPPPLPKKKNACVSVTVIGSGQHKRASSLTSSGAEVDSDDNDSNLSCDSLNSGELGELCKPPPSPPLKASAFLPQGLLQDIRERSVKLDTKKDATPEPELEETLTTIKIETECPQRSSLIVDESTYVQRKLDEQQRAAANVIYDTDCFYDFHLNEHDEEDCASIPPVGKTGDESFAGYKDLLGVDGSSTIRSAKGTVRGVKNRVRAGIATFLQINSTTKSYKEKDAGKVVVYTTTMGIVRNTYHQCVKVKQILRTLLVKFEERDVFMSGEYQSEIRDRMRCDHILVPQVFVDGQHIGDAETIERLNETGELRRMLKPYKSMDACTTCQACGGYRLLPCPVCNGSKKSVHRNHFTTEFVALKCMNCDEVGLVKCSSCSS